MIIIACTFAVNGRRNEGNEDSKVIAAVNTCSLTAFLTSFWNMNL
jgi:hypothetical protein